MKFHTIAVLASLPGFVPHTAVPMEGRERSPAVVNPVLASPLRETINLVACLSNRFSASFSCSVWWQICVGATVPPDDGARGAVLS
jgi:hypothetical protein